ncbi:MAG: LCCL domain-containing protein [Gemmatimonadota bacterium]
MIDRPTTVTRNTIALHRMRIRLGFCWLLTLFAGQLQAQTRPPAEATTAPSITQIQWSRQADGYRLGQTVTVRCPPYGTAGTVWGSDIYTADSSICTAAVHAGVITFEAGGNVVLQMKPGLGSYMGTFRNGVETLQYGSWNSSFSVAAYVPPPPPPPAAPPPPPPVISWRRNAVGLSPNGRRFTFVCKPPAERATVHGVDLYSWESSICTAAVHAGVIKLERGGLVTIEMRPGLEQYAGSVRNAVTSTEGSQTILGFVFVRAETGRTQPDRN